MQVAPDIVDVRAVARKPVLNCTPNQLNESVFFRWCSVLQRLFKPGRKHVEQLGVPSNERKFRILRTEHDSVACCSAHDRTAEAPLQLIHVSTPLHQLYSQR